MNIPDSKRVALYARVSTRDKKQDVTNQLSQLRAFCVNSNWIIVNEYIDQASGKDADRAEFQALFAAAAKREFDLVLFWSLDRFSREGVLETLNLLQRLLSHGVEYRSFTEQYLDSCGIFKDAVLSILATIAKQERIRISERTIAGLERARRDGKRLGPPVKIHDKEQQEIKKLRAAGLGLGTIAKQMHLSVTSIVRVVGVGN